MFRLSPSDFVTHVVSNNATVDLEKNVHPAWSRDRSFYFHEGNGDDLLDFAVMRGYRDNLLKMIAGLEHAARPADLILSGHVHKNFECRLFWEPSVSKFRIAHEFYTENPAVYYHSYDSILEGDGKFNVPSINSSHIGYLENLSKSSIRRLRVQVTEEAKINEAPQEGGSGVWSIRTKP